MKILVGMSGGIDSSVAAWLLKQQGHEVIGATMSIWKAGTPYNGPAGNSCYQPETEEELAEIQEICRKIGIPHVVVDCQDMYEEIVLENFRSEYLSGRTPNPCVWCNSKIKFGALIDFARKSGIEFDKFATGHYARVDLDEETGRYRLRRAVDLHKDQTYFLHRLTQEQLGSVLFPLGGMLKKDVRKIDEEQGFHEVGQDESQDFYCGDYTDLLGVAPGKGNIVDRQGTVLGTHEGVWNYTIGQRKGLGIASERPLYVVELRPGTNEVVVGHEEDTLHTRVVIDDLSWSAIASFDEPRECSARIRSASDPRLAVVAPGQDGTLVVSFEGAVKAATPGQSLVVYDGDTVLCGGIIASAS